MSFWVRPTTADIGIRAFGRNQNDLSERNDKWYAVNCPCPGQDLNSIPRKVASGKFPTRVT